MGLCRSVGLMGALCSSGNDDGPREKIPVDVPVDESGDQEPITPDPKHQPHAPPHFLAGPKSAAWLAAEDDELERRKIEHEAIAQLIKESSEKREKSQDTLDQAQAEHEQELIDSHMKEIAELAAARKEVEATKQKALSAKDTNYKPGNAAKRNMPPHYLSGPDTVKWIHASPELRRKLEEKALSIKDDPVLSAEEISAARAAAKEMVVSGDGHAPDWLSGGETVRWYSATPEKRAEIEANSKNKPE